jgi:hypothetical protein
MSIFIITTIPYFVPYYNDWSPYRSITNDGEFGHSMLRTTLERDFGIRDEHLDITSLVPASRSALVIISPEIKFSSSELEFLQKWTSSGASLIVIGASKIMNGIAQNWDIQYDFDYGPIYDFTNNQLQNPSFPFITDGNEIYTSVIPHSITHVRSGDSESYSLTSFSSAESTLCIKNSDLNCNSPYTIGSISIENQVAFIADNWMLSNKYVQQFPENLGLLHSIISKLNPQIEQIIFDDSHYHWAPLNRKGVEAFGMNFIRNVNGLLTIIAVLAILVPIILATSSGVFSDAKWSDRTVTKKIGKRLETLYLDKVPAVPLTLEERFLVEEQLEQKNRGPYYFQHVANYLLNFLEQEKLLPLVPSYLIQGLELLQLEVIPKAETWDIIQKINLIIEEAKKDLHISSINDEIKEGSI